MAKRKAIALVETTVELNGKAKQMKTENAEIKRTVKHPDGSEIERSATLTLASPETNEEAASFFGDNLWKWAVEGYSEYLKQHVRMKLGGQTEDGRSNKELRLFNNSMTTYVEINEMTKEAAYEALIAKPKFAALKAVFEAMKETSPQSFDFTQGEIPVPKWFKNGVKTEEIPETEETDAK